MRTHRVVARGGDRPRRGARPELFGDFIVVASPIVLVAFVAIGCCSSPAYVAVAEARFRTEKLEAERIALPLSTTDRKRLLDFLRAGGDRDKVGETLVDPGAEARYARLLERLADAPLQPADLAGLFPKKPLRQVVDARAYEPPPLDPFAFSDDRYWWIFYRGDEGALGLLVMKAIPSRKPK